jgi:hypothetical protein
MNLLRALLFALLYPWRCVRCLNRGCRPIDYPDGATEWKCLTCGFHYWEEYSGRITPITD